MYKDGKIIEMEKLAELYERAGMGRKATDLRRNREKLSNKMA